MNRLLLHIPHSSILIPVKDGFTKQKREINKEIVRLTDWYTDDIFQNSLDVIVSAHFSRLFCDVERFSDDSKEVMANKGMGVLYEKMDDGRLLRNITPKLRKRILEDYYFPNHADLEKAAEVQLKNTGKAMIVDCHSFPDKPLKRDLDQNQDRPLISIGTNEFHTPTDIINLTHKFFSNKGLSVLIDKPYSGTIVPLKYLNKDKNVLSIMIELNRKIYLVDGTVKLNHFAPYIKRLIHEYLDTLRTKIYRNKILLP